MKDNKMKSKRSKLSILVNNLLSEEWDYERRQAAAEETATMERNWAEAQRIARINAETDRREDAEWEAGRPAREAEFNAKIEGERQNAKDRTREGIKRYFQEYESASQPGMRLYDVLPDINVERVRVTDLDDRLKRMVTLKTADKILNYLDRRFIDRLRAAPNREEEMRMVSQLLGGEPLRENLNMKITSKQLKSLVLKAIKEQVETGAGQKGRSPQRREQAAALISATNLRNAEAVLKLLARQTEGDISPDQKRYLNMLTGRTSREDLKVVLDKFYVDGLNGKSILGYSAMTPNKLKDLINNMKSAKAAVGSEETPSEEEEVDADEEETGKKYQTKAMTGGASLEDIAKELGVSVQRAAEIEKKALERFKKAAVSRGGLESKESLQKIAVPAAKQFVERLGELGVEDFVMDVLKMPRATEKDIELLVDLQAMAEEGAEEEAAAELVRLYLRGSKLPVIARFTDALRAKETAGRPSLVRKFF